MKNDAYQFPFISENSLVNSHTQASSTEPADDTSKPVAQTSTPEVTSSSSTETTRPSSSTTSIAVSSSNGTYTNTSSNSDTRAEISEPGPGSLWIPITVRNPSSNRNAQPGTSASVTIDHAALVTAGTKPSGSDLRIYTIRNGLRKQLDRVLDPESGWNRNDTKIWFKIDDRLSGLQSETDIYHLVIDGNTRNPANDPKKVFLIYDDFNGPTLQNWTPWAYNSSGGGSASTNIVNHEMVMSASSNSGVQQLAVRSTSLVNVPAGVAMEASLTFENHSATDECRVETLLGIWSETSFDQRALWVRSGPRWRLNNRGSDNSIRVQNLNNTPIATPKRRHTMLWSDAQVTMYSAGQFVGTHSPELTGFTHASDGPLRFGFMVQTNATICNQSSRLIIDWVMVRQAHSSSELETTLRLGDEFVQP